MKSFIKDILPNIARYSKRLDELTLLTNQHWVLVESKLAAKVVFIFRSNSDLLISTNGKVEKGKWEYLGNNSILIEKPNENLLFKHAFFDNSILALKVDGTSDFAFFVNETQIGRELNNVEDVLTFLDEKYISRILPKSKKTNLNVNELSEINAISGVNGKWGYIDKQALIIIDFKFDKAYKFKNNFARVIVDGKYGIIDRSGNYVVLPNYEYIEIFNEGLALARLNNKYGYLTESGMIAIDFVYDEASSFLNGIAKVKFDGTENVIQRNEIIDVD